MTIRNNAWGRPPRFLSTSSTFTQLSDLLAGQAEQVAGFVCLKRHFQVQKDHMARPSWTQKAVPERPSRDGGLGGFPQGRNGLDLQAGEPPSQIVDQCRWFLDRWQIVVLFSFSRLCLPRPRTTFVHATMQQEVVDKDVSGASLLTMDSSICETADDVPALIERAVVGDEAALAALFERPRSRLRQRVRLRLDRRLLGPGLEAGDW